MKRALITTTALASGFLFSGHAQANMIGQLGVLDSGTGLQSGDQYRLVFITSGTTDATSSVIDTYNSFVTNQAGASTTFNRLDDVNWYIMGSTVAVDARDNTSTNPGVDGAGVPIFLVDGTTKVADNNGDLWDNSLDNTITLDQSGNVLLENRAFTGSYPSGVSVGPNLGGDTALGVITTAGLQGVQTGDNSQTNQWWARSWKANSSNQNSVYAISEVLTAQAAPIYYDDFTSADSTPILNLAPDTNTGVPGATFYESNNFWSGSSVISNNRGRIGADNQASLPIASQAGFVQPQFLKASAILNIGTTAADGTPSTRKRGVGLGYFAAATTTAGNFSSDFRGLMITTDGDLILAQHGAGGAPGLGQIALIAQNLILSEDHTVSFEIDIVTGDIFNIMLNGVLQADINTTIFASDVNHVGLLSTSASGGTYMEFNDFTVTQTPEPGSLALLGLGGLLIVRRRRA